VPMEDRNAQQREGEQRELDGKCHSMGISAARAPRSRRR
jgi:hypothetical protein